MAKGKLEENEIKKCKYFKYCDIAMLLFFFLFLKKKR